MSRFLLFLGSIFAVWLLAVFVTNVDAKPKQKPFIDRLIGTLKKSPHVWDKKHQRPSKHKSYRMNDERQRKNPSR